MIGEQRSEVFGRVFTNRAIKSPCYTCDSFGTPVYPDCADRCADLGAYLEYQGLPVRRPDQPAAYWEKLNQESRLPLAWSSEAQDMAAWLTAHKEANGWSYKRLGEEIGIIWWRLHGIMNGQYKQVKPDIAAAVAAYRQREAV